MRSVWPSSPPARPLSLRRTRKVAAVIAAGKAAQAAGRHSAKPLMPMAVKAFQAQVAAREAAYLKAVLGK